MSWVAELTRLARRCPPGWELTRAASDGVDPHVERHIKRCERCAAEYQSLRDLPGRLSAVLSAPQKMNVGWRDAMGVRLRLSAQSLRPGRRRRVRLWVVASVSVVLMAIVAIASIVSPEIRRAVVWRVVSRPAPTLSTESRASIRAIGPARFMRAQLPPDELVRLDEGTLELEVTPLHASERFRVITGDAEVEVRGTSFKVSAAEHLLTAVHVWRGRVEVRSRDGAFAELDAGDGWIRGSRAGAAAQNLEAEQANSTSAHGSGGLTSSSPPQRRPQRKAPSASAANRPPLPSFNPAPAPRDQQQLDLGVSFAHAWVLLRRGDAKKAAAEFEQVERLARGLDLEEDALYWRAVAVGRAGDPAGARRLYGEFVDRFPRSGRAGEAASALGWLLLDADETRAARRAFERAAVDPSPHVRSNAQEGLRRTQEEDR